MYAEREFDTARPALRPTNWLRGIWVEARAFSPAKQRRGAGRYRSPSFARAKVFLPRGAEKIAAGKPACGPANARPSFS